MVDARPNKNKLAAEVLRSAIWLTLVVLATLPLILWWAFDFAGWLGLQAGLASAGLCWAASFAALFVRMQFSRPQDVVMGTLAAMLVRMGCVFVVGTVIASMFPAIVPAAFWGQTVVFFVVTLATETFLAVQWAKTLEMEVAQTESSDESLQNQGAKAV